MNSVFSIKLWLIFLRRMMLSCYPAEVAFLLFSKKTFLRVKESRVLRVILIFIVCDLSVRAIVFFAGVPFSGRYLIPWTIGLALLAGGGAASFADFAAKTARVSKNIVLLVAFSAIAIGYSVKALHPRTDKPWLREIPARIKALTPEGMEPVIMASYMDERFGYYADTNRLVELRPGDDWTILVRKRRPGGYAYSRWTPVGKGLDGLGRLIRGLGRSRVFIILRVDDGGCPASKVEELERLPGLTLDSTYTDKKKRRFNLYRFSEGS